MTQWFYFSNWSTVGGPHSKFLWVSKSVCERMPVFMFMNLTAFFKSEQICMCMCVSMSPFVSVRMQVLLVHTVSGLTGVSAKSGPITNHLISRKKKWFVPNKNDPQKYMNTMLCTELWSNVRTQSQGTKLKRPERFQGVKCRHWLLSKHRFFQNFKKKGRHF